MCGGAQLPLQIIQRSKGSVIPPLVEDMKCPSKIGHPKVHHRHCNANMPSISLREHDSILARRVPKDRQGIVLLQKVSLNGVLHKMVAVRIPPVPSSGTQIQLHTLIKCYDLVLEHIPHHHGHHSFHIFFSLRVFQAVVKVDPCCLEFVFNFGSQFLFFDLECLRDFRRDLRHWQLPTRPMLLCRPGTRRPPNRPGRPRRFRRLARSLPRKVIRTRWGARQNVDTFS
mmetsp:Transcript_18624/g.52430  ORF Transcript_18624/g.52430 Transcript_18624/m.52430 type:complete len:227 (-) Transcript_18624:363-1043(-)